MNEGEKSIVNVCQEKNSGEVLKKHNYEVVTPVRRSTRIKKVKVSDEVGNKGALELNDALKNIELPKEKVQSENTTSNQANADTDCNSSTVSSVNKGLDASDTIFQINDGEEKSLEAMFDDIFEQRYSKTPKKLSNDQVKDRKFFKRDSSETSKLNFSSYLCNSGNLPAEDVSKVFKIISKPNPLSDITADSKPSSKPLKTYSNKRKCFQKTNVIESFGLPDHPIAPENIPLIDDELDVTIENVNDITILDMEYITEPWIIAAEGEDLFPVVEEIRTKSEPTHDPFKKNGSFLDFADSFESFIEPAIYTSAPFNSRVSGNDSLALKTISKNTKSIHRNKEIDIEAIKINFKKILSRTDISEPQKQVNKPSNFTSKKKNSICSKNANISSANTDILFVEENSLTVDNKEFEFSHNLIVPKSNSLGISDENISKNDNKRESNIIGKKLRSSVGSGEEKEERDKSRDKLRTLSRKQKSLPADESVEGVLPKKVSETDKFISKSKCNLQKEKHLDQQKSTKEGDKITFECSCFDKRILRSAFQNSPSEVKSSNENSTNEINNDGVKKCDCSIKVNSSNVNSVIEKEPEKSETLKKKVRSSNSHAKVEQNKNISEIKSPATNVNAKNKRTLRSASQESLEQTKPSNLCNIEDLNRQRNKIVSDVKVTLEKCKFENDLSLSVTDSSTNTTSNFQEIPQENKDMAILNEKLPEHSKNAFHNMSPPRRKLRSTKAATNQITTDQKERGLVNESSRQDKKSSCDAKNVAVESSSVNESMIDNSVATLEGKKSELEERIIDNKDSHKTEINIKTRRKDKFISKSLTSIDSLTSNGMEGIENKVKKHHSLCSEIKTAEEYKKDSEFNTIEVANLHHDTNLIEFLNKEQNNDEIFNTIANSQTIDKNISLNFPLCSVYLENTDVSISESYTITECTVLEENCEAEQSVDIKINKSPTMKKTERNDETVNLKCNVKVNHNLDLSNNYTCSESQKAEENENLKTDKLPPEDNQIVQSDVKNNVSEACNSKVEDLLKEEEDKIMFTMSLTAKTESTKYSDKTKLLDENICIISEKIVMVEYTSANLSSDSQISKTKTDSIKESSTSTVEPPEGTIEENGNVLVENNKTQDITETESQDQGSENSLKNENVAQQDTCNKFEEIVLEKQNLAQRPEEIISPIKCISDETHLNKLNLDKKFNTIPHTNTDKEILDSTTNYDILTKSRNKVEDKSEKVVKHPGSSARLKEKRRKLLGAKALSAEESIKRRSSNESSHPPMIKETLTDSSHSCLELPLIPTKKRGRPKKSKTENDLSPQKPTKPKSRGKPPRRKSSTSENDPSPEKSTQRKSRGRSQKRKSDTSENDVLPEKLTRHKSRARSQRRKSDTSENDLSPEKPTKPKSRGRRTRRKSSTSEYDPSPEKSTQRKSRGRSQKRKSDISENDVLPEKLTRHKSRARSRRRESDTTENDLSPEKPTKYKFRGRSQRRKSDTSENDLLLEKPVGHKSRGRSQRRKSDTSENDMSLVKRIRHKSRGRSRRRKSDISENDVSPEKATKLESSGRSPRRKSLDDTDLLRRYKEYRKQKIRSKSMAPSTLESRRKAKDRDSLESSKYWIDLYAANKDCEEDNTDLLNKYKDEAKSRNVANKIETMFRSGDELQGIKNWTSKFKSRKVNESQDGVTSNKVSETDAKNSINIKKSQSLGNLSSMENIHPGSRDFKVGDITWAQIGWHPFWPCLITKEPGTSSHKKIFQAKRFQKEMYHVRFFGDNGRRAWISKQQIMLYSNRDDLKLLREKMKYEKKRVPSGYIVTSKSLQKWERAIDEAEQVKLKSVKEKLLFFTDIISKINPPKERESTPPGVSISVKRKSDELDKSAQNCLSPPIKKSSDEKTKRMHKKKVSGENEALSESKEEVIEDINQIHQIEDNIEQNESILNKTHPRRQIDEISEIDSKTSSDNITDSDTSLNAMEAQKTLYKRNNLFKGISRDKVCQYCFKPVEVLKCRGRCNGSYHVSCSLKILLEKIPRKRREKNVNKDTLDHLNVEIIRNNVDKSTPTVNSECLNESTEIDDQTVQNGENFKSPLTAQDQVQIITVPSSVYNTPPRKTFPPDFKNMTLAEQIDYKMKEIMRKFETKTFYADSCSDLSSEQNPGKLTLSQATGVNTMITNLNKSDESKINELGTNDGAKNDTNLSNDIQKLTTYNNIDKQIEKTLKPITKKPFYVKHVTADCDGLKTDTIQEEKSNADKDSFGCSEVDPKNFKCGFCTSDLYPYCFICHLAVSKKGSNIRQKCSIYPCGRFYHPECLKMWPQTQWSLIQTTRHKDSDKDMDSFVCPLHVCHTCVSDDPRAATARCSGDKIVKCLRCPSTYHSSNLCVPAGTAILSSSQIICPRHREKSKSYTINTTWCFLCSEGGNLICCETCPTSVHPECLPVNLTDDDKFICEDCESGRLPLYDEIVWVKLGKFRWWPALILFPNEVPDNIRNMKHSIGEFVVKFLGTYDYYWVTRGRSFLFQEGDAGQCNSVRKKVDAAFNRAVEEAVVAHKLKKEFKLSQEVESITSLKPPPYIRIKVNKPVGNVRHLDLDLSSTNACECDPNKPHPCGPESDCLNRLLLTECNPEVCPAGTRCKNQSFEKREYPPLVPYKTQGRGWGLKTLAPIKKGQFVIEYVGELIDSEEYQRRIQKMHQQKEENYYFLTIDKDRMIDAGPKGNAARFMNHCCQPNCETQKWTVNGDTRVGLFATEDIPADTELTFNYNLECVGKEKKVCRCGASNCSGFIGVKAKQDTDIRKPKKSVKKKVPVEPVVLPPCFICGKKGLVISCNNKVCNKTYHQECLKTTEQVEGNKFICPWHNCSVCSKRTIRCCVKCINSYCPSHSDGNIRYDNLLGFVCTTHDPTTLPNDVQPVYKRRKNNVITEETAVTSTTSDDADDDEDWLPLLTRLERMRSKGIASVDSESDNESNINAPSTSLMVYNYESQDEDAVSSATPIHADGEMVVKRKRGRPRKVNRHEKKIKLSNEENIGITASSSTVENRLINLNNSELTSRDNNLENR
ncbi:uncharacterized protein LOC108917152 isoform X2 [Anoplophora glabripennis]|uniref:uncharacterized protein LOC108917152 isoform X2 n=1 Tax=Anoplophora glabripennis TaxID=217634 RepID=UPI000873F58C|nr:uncharacterized protein LOC108917152 isoform X2 [Anoplophora glabripennis]